MSLDGWHLLHNSKQKRLNSDILYSNGVKKSMENIRLCTRLIAAQVKRGDPPGEYLPPISVQEGTKEDLTAFKLGFIFSISR